MTKKEAADAIRRVVARELTDVERSINSDKKASALNDLAKAMIKLKRIIRELEEVL